MKRGDIGVEQCKVCEAGLAIVEMGAVLTARPLHSIGTDEIAKVNAEAVEHGRKPLHGNLTVRIPLCRECLWSVARGGAAYDRYSELFNELSVSVS